jgi:hypothetical protein
MHNGRVVSINGLPQVAPTLAGLFHELAFTCRIVETDLTRTARGVLNRAAHELHAINATPFEVRRRGEEYRRRWPRAALTPMALVKHWPSLFAERVASINLGRGLDAPPIWTLDEVGRAIRV